MCVCSCYNIVRLKRMKGGGDQVIEIYNIYVKYKLLMNVKD